MPLRPYVAVLDPLSKSLHVFSGHALAMLCRCGFVGQQFCQVVQTVEDHHVFRAQIQRLEKALQQTLFDETIDHSGMIGEELIPHAPAGLAHLQRVRVCDREQQLGPVRLDKRLHVWPPHGRALQRARHFESSHDNLVVDRLSGINVKCRIFVTVLNRTTAPLNNTIQSVRKLTTSKNLFKKKTKKQKKQQQQEIKNGGSFVQRHYLA